jgi:ribosomal protein L2
MNFNPNRKRSNLHIDLVNSSFKYKKYLKKFIVGHLKPLGRSNGMIVMAHKGGGVKKNFRLLGNYEQKTSGIIRSVEYDPNRSSNIGLIQYKNGTFSNRIYSSKNYKGQILQTYNYKNHKNIK